jgi:hypothetical protein
MEKRAVKVGRPAWKADRGSNTMGIVLPLLRHSMVDIHSESVYIHNIRNKRKPYMNIYVFQKATETAIRCIWIEEDADGIKSVANIYEMHHDGSKASLKKTIKCLYEMMYIGKNGEYEIYASKDDISKMEYDASLEGKARKHSSKEINVLTEQLFG